jgi:flagellum-specific ATP synthase
MDSVTRFAMAQREIGLAVGEPPATRGYTPSVFATLPRLLERSGAGENGAITALYTVLVEGDDMNEPVADAVRGILDGHIVLSRALAHANHYPAIDVLESISRLTRDVCNADEVASVARAREHLAAYRKNEDIITIGAYQKGSSAALDQAVTLHEPLKAFLRQSIHERVARDVAFSSLKKIVS